MRKVTLFCSLILLSAVSFGQNGRGIAGFCPYGCGPYVPLLTTPSLSFATVSLNPVGATNATGGLLAGATNSTLSEISVNTDAVYTVPLWYSGGQAPLMSPIVRGREMREENKRVPEREMMMKMHHGEFEKESERGHREEMRGERENAEREAAPVVAWVYYSPLEKTGNARAAKSYSNDDVARQEQKNGDVKYGGKTEKIQ